MSYAASLPLSSTPNMRQIVLDWELPQAQTLHTFVSGHNAELLQRLQGLQTKDAPHGVPGGVPGGDHEGRTDYHAEALNERFIYLWGAAAAGKTHLLKAMALSAQARYLAADAEVAQFQFDPAIAIYLIDDCERLSPLAQIAVFNLFNEAREQGATLIAAGAAPPAQLVVREDLRTRLGWGLIYQVHGLSDDEKIAALTQTAHARGFSLSPGVLPYLITHFHRDMRSLSAMLDALDRYSLETHRPITLPLLRSLLQLEGEVPDAPTEPLGTEFLK